MKFKKTTTMILAAAVLLSASLTACSNVETDEAAAESSAAETSAAESSIETTAAETETEETTPESSSESSETDTDPENRKFIYDIRDATETGSAYMRVYFYLGDELQGMTLASADEGKDSIPFTFLPSELYTYTAPEDLEEFKLECYLGYSDLEPDDAVMHAYSGEDVDEVYVGTIENAPAPGEKYDCDIVVDPSSETGYSIVIE